MPATETTTTVNPVFIALAQAHPELNSIRWRIRLADDTELYIAGERMRPDPSIGGIGFVHDDGTQTVFREGQWKSARSMPGAQPEPTLDAIVRRLHAFDLISNHDLKSRGRWLQAQPEWFAHEVSCGNYEQARPLHTCAKRGF